MWLNIHVDDAVYGAERAPCRSWESTMTFLKGGSLLCHQIDHAGQGAHGMTRDMDMDMASMIRS